MKRLTIELTVQDQHHIEIIQEKEGKSTIIGVIRMVLRDAARAIASSPETADSIMAHSDALVARELERIEKEQV